MGNDRFSDKAVMSARQVAEFDHAVERNGGTADDVKWLSSGSALADVFKVRSGDCIIVSKATLMKLVPQFRTLADDLVLTSRFAGALANWRRLAKDLDYSGPVAWLVPAGFHIKKHAPLLGPSCYEQFKDLQNCIIKGDQDNEATVRQLVFWIPRVIPASNKKKAIEQLALLAKVREDYDLPEHHLTSFGRASLLSGLMLTHYNLTQEKTPLCEGHVRTDSVRDIRQLILGGTRYVWFHCDFWSYGDWDRHERLWCFPLGAEALEPGELEAA